jgi:hypothetical protein
MPRPPQEMLAKFIGGPLDGEVQDMPLDLPRYRAAVMSEARQVGPMEAMVDVTYTTYVKRDLMGTEVWAPDGMRDAQVIELLVQRYRA